jgi:hypothetical protein
MSFLKEKKSFLLLTAKFLIMNKYMLLFRNTEVSEDAYQNMSPEEMQADLEKWNAWIGGIAAQGKLLGAEALMQVGKVVSTSKHVISDGPYVESKELVSGYLNLEAESIEEAIELAKGCPIFNMEGSVEVRQIMVFGE